MELADILNLDFQGRIDYILSSQSENLNMLDGMYYCDLLGIGTFGSAHLIILANRELVVEKKICISTEGIISENKLNSAVKEVYFGILLQSCDFTPNFICARSNEPESISMFFTYTGGDTVRNYSDSKRTYYTSSTRNDVHDFVYAMWEEVSRMLCTLYLRFNVCHRDLSSENIMYKSGKFYLIDFGRAVIPSSRMTIHPSEAHISGEGFLTEDINIFCVSCLILLHQCDKGMMTTGELLLSEYFRDVKHLYPRFAYLSDLCLKNVFFTIEDAQRMC